jgi:hypothetical protein
MGLLSNLFSRKSTSQPEDFMSCTIRVNENLFVRPDMRKPEYLIQLLSLSLKQNPDEIPSEVQVMLHKPFSIKEVKLSPNTSKGGTDVTYKITSSGSGGYLL